MTNVCQWSAKRSGAAITVRGTDRRTGKAVVFTGITELVQAAHHVVAFIGDHAACHLYG